MTRYVKVKRSTQMGNSYTPTEYDIWVGELDASGENVDLLYQYAGVNSTGNSGAIDEILALLRSTETT